MKIMPNIFLVLLFAVGFASANEHLHLADSCYAARALHASGVKANPKNAEIMKDAYKKAMEDPSVLEKATEGYVKSLYFCFRFVNFDKKLRESKLDSLKAISESAYNKFPKNKEIAHVYASALSIWGNERGALTSVKEGVATKVRDVATAAEDWQVLGRAHTVLPYVPVILTWPDSKLADKYLNLALEKNRKDVYNYYYLADFYNRQKRYDDAVELIVQGMDLSIRPGFVFEDKRGRWHLQELCKTIYSKQKKKLSPKHLEDCEKIQKSIEAKQTTNKN